MVSAALQDGTADRHCVFEVFARASRRDGAGGGGGHRATFEAYSTSASSRGDRLSARYRCDRRRHRRVAIGVPVHRRHRRLRRGGTLLSRLAIPPAPRSPNVWCWKPWFSRFSIRQRGRRRRCADGTAARGRTLIEMGSRRTTGSRDRRCRAAYLAGSRPPPTWRPGAAAASDRGTAHAYTLVR